MSESMRLEWRSPQELAENPKNWRRHPKEQLDALTDVISEVGWAGALLFNERTGRLIDGHGRRKVALEQGTEKVPVLVGDWSEQDEAKILATLDPIANMANADTEALKELLAGIETQSDAINAMLEELAVDSGIEPPATEEVDADPQISRADELAQIWGVERGQVWELGEHRLMCGDSTIDEDYATLMGDDKPGMMVTDPPYGVEYDPEWRLKSGINKEWQTRAEGTVENDDVNDWTEVWKKFPGNVAYVWHAGKYASEVQQSLERAGFIIRSQIIWAKPSLVISRGHYHWQHEPCWYAVRKGQTANWFGDRKQSTLWEIANMHRTQGKVDDGKTVHATQKPVECMLRAIANHDYKIIFEPFSGSGTTIMAGEQLKRKVFAMEISPGYVAVALQRWADATGKTPELSK